MVVLSCIKDREAIALLQTLNVHIGSSKTQAEGQNSRYVTNARPKVDHSEIGDLETLQLFTTIHSGVFACHP